MNDRDLANRRIVIVSGHFTPEVGYQEVDLARAFTRLGAHVRVVTSTRLSTNARALVRRDYKPGSEHIEGYEVVRLKPRITIGPNILGCDVQEPVSEFDPDDVILVGPGKLFGADLFSRSRQPWHRVAIMQDNNEDGSARNSTGRKRIVGAVAHWLVKRPVYRRVVRHADRMVLNVPDTYPIVERWLSPPERELFHLKALELRLGFDPDRFYFDRVARQEWREHHSVAATDIVLATCTRVVRSKGLEVVIEAISALRRQGVPIRYVLAGLLGDEYEEELRSVVHTQPEPDAFLLLPGQKQDDMRRLFCAADFGYWPRAAISIQQAMGTGLPVLLQPTSTVSQLVDPGRNGWYLAAGESLEHGLARAARSVMKDSADAHAQARELAAKHNSSYLSYDAIGAAMINGLD